MDKIFVVQAIHSIDGNLGERNLGWYRTMQEARDSLKMNAEVIADVGRNGVARYQYALIESVEPGIYPVNSQAEWYRFNSDTSSYAKIKTPKRFEGVIGFTMG